MRRSIENAEHVGTFGHSLVFKTTLLLKLAVRLGLFAPRVGQQYRDEQRRRRSQCDRGTTAADRGEVIYVRTYTPRRSHGINTGPRTAPCTYPAAGMWCERPSTFVNGPRTS